MQPGQRRSVGGETGAQPIDGGRVEEAVPHVVRPGPEQLHGLADRLRQLDRFVDVVHEEPAPEAATEQGRVHLDRLGRQAVGLDDVVEGGLGRLRRRPDLARFLPHVGRAVHRLERGMRLERILVDRLERGGCGAHRTFRIPVPANRITVLRERLFHRPDETLRIEVPVRSGVPRHAERFAALEGGPGVVRGHRHAGRNPALDRDDMAHTGDRQGLARVEACDLAAHVGTPFHHRDEHAGHAHVDAVDRAAPHDRRTIGALHARSYQTEIPGVLQRRIARRRLSGRRPGQAAVAERPARRRVDHRTERGAAAGAIDLPDLRRRCDQHRARGRSRQSQGAERPGAAAAAAGAQPDALEARAGHRLLEPHPARVHFQLLGQQDRESGAHPLSHLGARHPERDRVVRGDLDVGVRPERRRRGVRRIHDSGHPEAHDQPRPRGGACMQESTARDPHALFASRAAR